MVKIHSFEYDGHRVILEGETIKCLYVGFSAATTTGTTAHNMEGNANYQVPSGKTFRLLGFIASLSQRTIFIYSSTVVDSTTGEVNKWVSDNMGGEGMTVVPSTSLTWAQNLWVTLKTSSTSSSWRYVLMYGIET